MITEEMLKNGITEVMILESRIKELEQWFKDYELLILQFERENRIQQFPIETVLEELKKQNPEALLPELITFNKNIVSLEIEACLKHNELIKLKEEFANSLNT